MTDQHPKPSARTGDHTGREPVAIGLDVGGTKLIGAAIAADGTILDRRRVTTPRNDDDALVEAIADLARDVGGADLPLGIGIAGIVTPAGRVVYATNLGVADLELGAPLAKRLGDPVVVKNDATVALYGEYRVGAAEDVEDVVMLTIGTGVGGAVIVDGLLVDGSHSFAGELGHILVHEGGRPCPCGNLGCLEAYASGTAIGKRAAQRLDDEELASSLRDVAPGELVGKHVTTAANDGDAFAQSVLEEAGFWLGVGAASIVNALDPARMLVGGGASTTSAEWVLPAAREAMAERVMGGEHRPIPRLDLGVLADDAGMIGAALLAAEHARTPGS